MVKPLSRSDSSDDPNSWNQVKPKEALVPSVNTGGKVGETSQQKGKGGGNPSKTTHHIKVPAVLNFVSMK